MRAFIACLFIALLMTGAPKAQNLTPDQFVAVLHDMKKEWDGLIAIHEKHRAAACKSLTGDEGTICNMLFKTIVERRKAELAMLETKIVVFKLPAGPDRDLIAVQILSSDRFNKSNEITNDMWLEAIKKYPAR